MSDSKLYPQILNLDRKKVFFEDTYGDYLSCKYLPEILSVGKHYFTIAFNDPPKSKYFLKNNSQILFEFKDANDKTIFSDVSNLTNINGISVCYVWIRRDPLKYYDKIADGLGTLTIIGELGGVPKNWENKHNLKYTKQIEIRKDIQNTSPVIIQSASKIQTDASTVDSYASLSSLVFSESRDFDNHKVSADTLDPNYIRSYINISCSNLDTYGGRISDIQLLIRESGSRKFSDEDYTFIGSFAITGSKTKYTSSTGEIVNEYDGLNPSSIKFKFPTPRDIRRKHKISYKLRFLNPNGELVKDIANNEILEITSSDLPITGSPLILEEEDNLVTGSLSFGNTIDDSIKLLYNKTKQRLDFIAGAGTTYGSQSRLEGVGGIVTSSEASPAGTLFSIKALSTHTSSMIIEGDLRATGKLIAQEYIVSSSVTTMSIAFSSGSTAFGDDTGDTHRFTGSVSISGSGTDLRVAGNLDMSAVGQTISCSRFFDNTGMYFQIGEYEFFRLLRGSGPEVFEFNRNGDDIDFKIKGSDSLDNSMLLYADASAGNINILYNPESGGATNAALHVGGDINTTSHITASGNISSSEYVYAKRVFLSGNDTLRYSTANSGLYINGGIQTIGNSTFGNSVEETHTFTGHITASGNISGSSTSTINVGGNITSLGTITAEQITSTDDMTVTDDLNVQGQINLASDIVHTLDANTKIAFATDRITLTAGGVDLIDLREASPDTIAFGAAISSHITASGNISSSGYIYGNILQIQKGATFNVDNYR